MLRTFCTALLISASLSSVATTWDEPWQDEVVREASHFVFAQVLSYDEDNGVRIKIIKTLGGEAVQGEIEIADFYLLDICSSSGGHGPGFDFENITDCYFFLKKNIEGKYCIATPTSGFAKVEQQQVYATYRHSYHQALVPIETYEMTMTAIFNHYHQLGYDKQALSEYIEQYISLQSAGFEESEIDLFFAQHVVLETIYHLRLDSYCHNTLPFLNDTANFHNQVSAARALTACAKEDTGQALMTVIADTSRGDFVRVMCIWTLATFKPAELKAQLETIQGTASTDMNGFGGNIMDPRVCTHVPDVKAALTTLIESL